MDAKHHAYILEAISLPDVSGAVSFIELHTGIFRERNPDFVVVEKETIGIDDARRLKGTVSLRPSGEGKRVILLSCRFLTNEAQNSLLKLFEEPPADTLIFLCGVEGRALLPTLRSRLAAISVTEEDGAGRKEAEAFLASSIPERLTKIARYISKEEKEDGAKGKMLRLFFHIETYYRAQMAKRPENAFLAEHLRDMMTFRQFLLGRSPSLKMIGEYLAITLPVLSLRK